MTTTRFFPSSSHAGKQPGRHYAQSYWATYALHPELELHNRQYYTSRGLDSIWKPLYMPCVNATNVSHGCRYFCPRLEPVARAWWHFLLCIYRSIEDWRTRASRVWNSTVVQDRQLTNTWDPAYIVEMRRGYRNRIAYRCTLEPIGQASAAAVKWRARASKVMITEVLGLRMGFGTEGELVPNIVGTNRRLSSFDQHSVRLFCACVQWTMHGLCVPSRSCVDRGQRTFHQEIVSCAWAQMNFPPDGTHMIQFSLRKF